MATEGAQQDEVCRLREKLRRARDIVALLLSECVESTTCSALGEKGIRSANAFLAETAPDEKAKGADHDRR
jgi:hypothetical protein